LIGVSNIDHTDYKLLLMRKVAKEWNVAMNVVAFVHDGTANFKDVGDKNTWQDVNCAAHKLQLHISASMGTDKVTSHPTAKYVVSESWLVGHFVHSPTPVNELMKRQAVMMLI